MALQLRPHNRAGLRQGEVGEVDGPHLRAGIHGTWGHFAPVKVNDILTLDFDNSDDPAAPITMPSWRGRGV